MANATVKLAAHTDGNPIKPTTSSATLFLKLNSAWLEKQTVTKRPADGDGRVSAPELGFEIVG